jgi:hypothetical protein
MKASDATGDIVPPAAVAVDRIAASFVMAATLSCYLLTAPRTVVLADDGFFLQAAWFSAAAHPPGYPLYVALAHVATLVPLGTVAFRVHALSGLFAALACVMLYRTGRALNLMPATAAAAALALGFSGVFWSQAIIAEVYSLNVLLFLTCAASCVRIGYRPDAVTARDVALLGALAGLAIANHWPLFLASAPMLLLLAWPALAAVLRHSALFAAGLLAGLLPYAWMVWRTHAVPGYCFAGPITNWAEFLFYVGRRGYAAADHNPGAGWPDRVQFAGFVARETVRQFTLIGAALGAAGFALQWRLWGRRIAWSLTLGFLGGTLLLTVILGFDYDEFHRQTFRVYPLIPYSVFALWIGLGLQWLRDPPPALQRAGIRGGPLQLAAGTLLLGLTAISHAPANYRARDTWGEDYAAALLRSLPANAVFYSNADTVNGPVGYLHYVERVRPDVRLVNGHSLELDGRLVRPYGLSAQALRRVIASFVTATAAPVFYTNDFPHDYGEDFYGLYFQVNRGAPATVQRAVLVPAIAQFYRLLDSITPPADGWESMHFRLLREDECRLLASMGPVEATLQDPPSACLGLQGRLFLAGQALAHDSRAVRGVARKLLRPAGHMLEEAIYKKERVRYEQLRAEADRLTR